MKMTLDPDLAVEAKAIVALAFRNGPIEDLHAGSPCTVCCGNQEFSHISDEEMKSRLKNFKAPEPRFKRGVFAKYANNVSSASEGAVTT